MQQFKIVTDSSSDMMSFERVPFAVAPLKIITSEKEYIDDSSLDVDLMVNDLQYYKGRSSTSCPNSMDWLNTFGDADRIFCIVITATLSGAYNAALIAKKMYEEQYPDRKVFVLNSMTTGPELKLIVEKIADMIAEGNDYEVICEKISDYTKKTGLLFVLESMKNLANNGRVSHLAAKAAGLLGIRVLGKASDKGDLEQLDKCRGQERTISTIVSRLKELGYKSGKIRIGHVFNPAFAYELSVRIKSIFDKADIEIYGCRGLCSFYAERGGILIGYEK